jgi:MSHA biogenesis protein MshL
VTLRAASLPRLTVLRMLARAAGLRLELGHGATNNDPISLDVSDEPVDLAAGLAVADLGWSAEIAEGRLTIVAERRVGIQMRFPYLTRSYSTSFGSSGGAGTIGTTTGTTTAGATTTAVIATPTTGTGTTTTTTGTQAAATQNLTGNVSVSYSLEDGNAWAKVEEVARYHLGDRGQLVIHKDTGLVWLRGEPLRVDEAVRALKQIDRELSRQVFLEVSVIDVLLSDRTRWGIDWQKVFTLGHQWGGLQILQPPIGVAGSLAGAAFTVKLSRVERPDSIILRALEEQGRTRVLSQPRLLVANGQTALLQVGEVVPFVSSVTQTVAGQSGTVIATPTIGQVQSGLTVAISPRVLEDEILIQLSPVINNVRAFKTFSVGSNSFENPIVATKGLTTVARARAGETVILGGLIDTSLQDNQDGVPLLRRLPGLSVFFRNDDRQRSSRELVLLITPTIQPALPE